MRKPVYPFEEEAHDDEAISGHPLLVNSDGTSRRLVDKCVLAPGPENRAGGVTKSKGDLVPLLPLLKAGPFFRGTFHPVKGWATDESSRGYEGGPLPLHFPLLLLRILVTALPKISLVVAQEVGTTGNARFS